MKVEPWLALAIGNSRLHWGWFDRTDLLEAWDTPHFSPDQIHKLTTDFSGLQSSSLAIEQPELWLVSAVPEQTALWQAYPHTQTIALPDIPLHNLYPTLGVDRALAAWSASQQVGLPVLVIDGGTALTLTGINLAAELVGGAILPGLRLQRRSLAQSTTLPEISEVSELPPRWATNTPDAIRSGVIHSVTAGLQGFIADWQRQFPQSAIVLTGGDGVLLHDVLLALDANLALSYEPHLLLNGIAAYRSRSIADLGRTEAN